MTSLVTMVAKVARKTMVTSVTEATIKKAIMVILVTKVLIDVCRSPCKVSAIFTRF
jgi:hypothetical protein